jgi:oxygen-independent coproporphyrinogen-3 oxidase
MPLLYVHVPFCIQKCAYCAFYSLSRGESSEKLISQYLEGLELEMIKRQKDAPQGVSSLFIGGGTPTVLNHEQLECLMKTMNQYFQFESRAEMTVEGNPGTISTEKLRVLRNYGINRFSLGIQSFDDGLLSKAGRIHSARQAREAIKRLRKEGFNNLNFDLMFGLPGQNLQLWRASLEEALSHQPEHFSLYGLMLEEGTPFYDKYMVAAEDRVDVVKGRNLPDNNLPDDDLQAEMYAWATERLAREGYTQYETSNFARPGFECRHNLGYWRGEDYIGLGPGAVSCLKRVRQKNIEDVHLYVHFLKKGQTPLDEEGQEVLSLKECMAERMILGLRLKEGVDLTAFRRDFGADLRDIYREVLERYKHRDIFEIKDEHLCLNPKYSFVANGILQEFV